MYCSPLAENKSNYTCFTKKNLIKIAKAYNETYDNKIKYSTKTKKELWTEINNRLQSSCDNEYCWINKQFIKNTHNRDILYEKFRPKMPSEWKKDKNTWLNTYDIKNVMSQYEKKYSNFIFFGPVPADCPTNIRCELSDLDILDIKSKKIYNIGIVFNLDTHDKSGSHWVAVFADLNKCKIYYYDSYGKMPTKWILKFIENFIEKCKDANMKMNFYYNNTRHQFQNSECGVYSMNFIIELLKGKSFNEIIKQKIPDKVMNDLRFYLYRPE